jgi:hypothetical protein
VIKIGVHPGWLRRALAALLSHSTFLNRAGQLVVEEDSVLKEILRSWQANDPTVVVTNTQETVGVLTCSCEIASQAADGVLEPYAFRADAGAYTRNLVASSESYDLVCAAKLVKAWNRLQTAPFSQNNGLFAIRFYSVGDAEKGARSMTIQVGKSSGMNSCAAVALTCTATPADSNCHLRVLEGSIVEELYTDQGQGQASPKYLCTPVRAEQPYCSVTLY